MSEVKPAPTMFESIVGNLSSGIYVLQGDNAVYLNQHFAEFFGLDEVGPLVGSNMYTEVYPDAASVELFRNIHEQMFAQQMDQTSWAQISARRDGTPFWLEVEARMIEVNGEPAILGVFKDQTECQLIAQAMAVSQETLRLLLDAMEDRVYVVTDDYKIVYANKKMRDHSLGDMEKDPCFRVCRGLEEECGDCSMDEVFTATEPMYKEFFNDITQKWYSVIELPIRMPGEDRPTKLAVARDITARWEAEKRIRGLSHRLMSVQEEERKRLSRELHDDLGQRLNAVKMGVAALSEDLEGSSGEITERVVSINTMLQGSIQSVRQLSAGLRPPALERYGLVRTIREHCQQLSKTSGLEIDFQSPGMKEVKLDNKTEIKLFRVVQEAINNVVKHARANKVTIRLIASYPTVRLRIEDDGQGFDIEKHYAASNGSMHLGLMGMAERVDLLGGSFNINSQPGQGTRITVELPCQVS